jgi:hypothetical protein
VSAAPNRLGCAAARERTYLRKSPELINPGIENSEWQMELLDESKRPLFRIRIVAESLD